MPDETRIEETKKYETGPGGEGAETGKEGETTDGETADEEKAKTEPEE